MNGLTCTNRIFSRRQFLTGVSAYVSTSMLASAAPAADVHLTIQQRVIPLDRGRSMETTVYSGRPKLLKLPAGQPVRVLIDNQTREAEYVHWHGFKMLARYDGTCEEQSESVEAGQSLAYTLPPQSPGLYYVHSHAMTMHSLSRGPYSGQFIPVLVGDAQMAGISYDKEIVLASHEWGGTFVDQDGIDRSLEQMHHLRIDAEDEEGEAGDGGWEIRYRSASLGAQPLGMESPLLVKRGQRILFHIVNASATEPLSLHLPGHTMQIHSLDGYRVPVAESVETLCLGTGERASVTVLMDNPGCWIMGSIDDQARQMGMGVVIAYEGTQRDPVWSAPTECPEVLDYARFSLPSVHERPADAEVRLERRPKDNHGFEQWAMVWSGHTSPVVNKPFRIAIENATNENHPIHLHRHSFELKSFGGRALSGVRKDTVVVPAFQRVEMEYIPADSDPTLLHCHNQMHMDCGMKIVLQAIPRSQS